MNLRWIKRDGKDVLQMRDPNTVLTSCPPQYKWDDIPVVPEKQEEKKLREYFIELDDECPVCVSRVEFGQRENEIRVTELPSGSRVVSREMVLKAWKEYFLKHETTFETFLNLLGFGDDK